MSHLRASRNYIWNIADTLGVGATGAVYKCRNKRTGEQFAVKTFNVAASGRPRDVQMREFEVLRRLKHENIVALHDVEEELGSRGEVLIMDLCTGGSLFGMLDDPENAYGLEETEFLSVLNDVAAGMKHLRDNDIVHRDIKPGNIMRYISEDGRSIYKLIDFGAARELQDEEQFVSLYGTEEYLFPDMYERAVLMRNNAKQFGACVDLWSIGVTLYHVATGQLPFRPYGGPRRNKQLMHAMTTQKESGVISGVQLVEDGSIEWSRHLPALCRLSKGLKTMVTPLLARLLESKIDKMMKFDDFFSEVHKICRKAVVNVFHATTCSLLNIYIDGNEKLTGLQELIKEQTGLEHSAQRLMYENHELTALVSCEQPISSYPTTSRNNPIFLFVTGNEVVSSEMSTTSEAVFSSHIPAFPPEPTQLKDRLDVDADALYSKNCCAVAHFIGRCVSSLLRDQQLIVKAAKVYRLVLARDINQIYENACDVECLVVEMSKRVELLSFTRNVLSGAVKELSISRNVETKWSESGYFDGPNEHVKLNEHVSNMIDKIGALRDMAAIQPSLDNLWQQDSICQDADKCTKKMDILIAALRKTWSDFCNDRRSRSMSFNDEQIHRFERMKLKTNTGKIDSLIKTHCLPNTKKVFEHFTTWYHQIQKIQSQLDEVCNLTRKVSAEQRELAKNLDVMQQLQKQQTTSACEQLGVKIVPSSSSPINSSIVAITSDQFVFKARRSQDKERNRKAVQTIRALKHSLVEGGKSLDEMLKYVYANERILNSLEDKNQSSQQIPELKTQSYQNLDPDPTTLTAP